MLHKNPNIIKRNIHGTYFLIDITQRYDDNKCRLYEINETGSYIWDILDTAFTPYDVSVGLLSKYHDIQDASEIIGDVGYYCLLLKKAGFLRGEVKW
jgi:hypothetical protein